MGFVEGFAEGVATEGVATEGVATQSTEEIQNDDWNKPGISLHHQNLLLCRSYGKSRCFGLKSFATTPQLYFVSWKENCIEYKENVSSIVTNGQIGQPQNTETKQSS